MEGESVQLRGGGFEEFAELLAHVLFVAATSRVTQCETKVSELTEHSKLDPCSEIIQNSVMANLFL
jgi:hypothetical protein